MFLCGTGFWILSASLKLRRTNRVNDSWRIPISPPSGRHITLQPPAIAVGADNEAAAQAFLPHLVVSVSRRAALRARPTTQTKAEREKGTLLMR